MNARFATSLVFLAALTCGCVSRRAGGVSFRDREWEEGITLKREVVNAWGNPDAIRDDVWIWRENRHSGGRIKASYYGAGLSVSKINVATYEHHLKFNAHGRLEKRETHLSVSDGACWSINPW